MTRFVLSKPVWPISGVVFNPLINLICSEKRPESHPALLGLAIKTITIEAKLWTSVFLGGSKVEALSLASL
jgi:hypothetical protein